MRLARELGAREVSFLAVDVNNPHAFGRDNAFPDGLALDAADLDAFATVLDTLERDFAAEFASGFIAESPVKLRRLHAYFTALLGRGDFPPVRCNAPEFSAVLGLHGEVSPCFFIPGPARPDGMDPAAALDAPAMRELRAEIRAGRRPECTALRLLIVARTGFDRCAGAERTVTGTRMSGLSTLDVYERWAPGYSVEPHNPLMVAEQQVMLDLWPEMAGRDVLDLACGTGRYATLAERHGARRVVALDFSPAMLARARVPQRVRGDLCALPLRDRSFDVVVSGLALGHAADLTLCAREIRPRAARRAARCCTRIFIPKRRAAVSGVAFATPPARVSSCRWTVARWPVIARRWPQAGFDRIEQFDIRAGIELRADFPGAADFYREWHGAPLALVVRARGDGCHERRHAGHQLHQRRE